MFDIRQWCFEKEFRIWEEELVEKDQEKFLKELIALLEPLYEMEADIGVEPLNILGEIMMGDMKEIIELGKEKILPIAVYTWKMRKWIDRLKVKYGDKKILRELGFLSKDLMEELKKRGVRIVDHEGEEYSPRMQDIDVIGKEDIESLEKLKESLPYMDSGKLDGIMKLIERHKKFVLQTIEPTIYLNNILTRTGKVILGLPKK